MVLIRSRHKISSSIAHYVFGTQELPVVLRQMHWKIFTTAPLVIVQKEEHLSQMIMAIQLSVLARHMEILRQAFYEYLEKYKKQNAPLEAQHIRYLEDLGWFLFDMRNALGHTRNALVAKGPEKEGDIKYKGNFKINVPVNEIGMEVGFDAESKYSYTLSWPAIKVKKEIKIIEEFLYKITLLSYHVLEITKKQNKSILIKYLARVERASVIKEI
jgi:hypothetical protein